LRSKQDRKLGGVAGGLAAATNLDPTIVRLGIVLGCLTGWGILAYLIAWAVIPEEDPAKGRYLMPAGEPTGKHLRIGLAVLAGIGVLQVLGTVLGIVSSALIGLGLFPARIFGFRHDSGFDGGEALLGLFLLVGGCLLLFRRHLPWAPMSDTGSGGSGSWAPPTSTPTGMALATIAPGSGGGGATAGSYGPPPPSPDPAGMAGFSARASAAARAARTNGPLLVVRATGWLVGLWFLAGAVIGGVLWASGALDVSLPVIPFVTMVAALGALGFALIRSRRLAVVIGAMALLLVPSALAAALTRVDGQAGDRSVSPTVMTDLDREYRHALGVLNLDLSGLQLPAGRTAVHISMGAGKADVTVPWDANVEASAEVSAGSFDLFGSRQTGVNLDGKSRSTGQPGAPLLVITGRAGAGEIIVRRGYEPFTQQALRTGQPVPLECHPAGYRYGPGATGPLRCTAADGVTQTPALACVVSEHGGALCRPPGEAEPIVDFANYPGTRRCQVPAGGGEATCGPPIPGSLRSPGQGTFTCSIPYGGGPAVCRPTGAGFDPGAEAPTPPGAPTPPAPPTQPGDPETTPTTAATTPPPAAPGEYLCTVPEDGGQATCQPA
jgi:phage shock protein PspC (stress-responsive transcriptional regulator)